MKQSKNQRGFLNFWPFRKNGRDYALSVQGTIEANNGETLGQLTGCRPAAFLILTLKIGQ